jgi:DNA-binding NarL/FixJ family response regulator
MRVLIAGKKASLRNALTTLLQTRSGIEIAGTVSDIEELFVQVKSEPADLLLLDENLTEKLVEDVIIPIQQIDSPPMVMVLGDRTETKQAVLDAGAVAFIDKSDPPKSLLTAIEEIRLRRNRV